MTARLLVSQGLNFPPFAYWRSSCLVNPNLMQGGIFLPDSNATQDVPAEVRQRCFDMQLALPGVGWCYPGSGYCTEDRHFIVWMRTAGLPSFRKLFAAINTPLEAGTYSVQVTNGINALPNSTERTGQTYFNFGALNGSAGSLPTVQKFLYPVGSFGGSKSVVLSTTTWIGGKNLFLGYAYLVVGAICIVLAICFFVKSRCSPRDPGSAPFVSWNRDAPPK